MTGLDTNVVVRYIMQDDVTQSRLATKLIESLSVDEPGYIPLIAFTEISWVLSGSYNLNRQQLMAALEGLLTTKEIIVEATDVVWRALRNYRDTAADFADSLIERSASAAGCVDTMTFDRGAAKNCGMTLIR